MSRPLFVTTALGVLALLLTPALPALGQTQTEPPPPAPYYPGTGPAENTNVYGGGGGWGGGYHSSTAAGDQLQGMASAISAQGQKNLNDSMAVRNLTAARSAQIDNQVKHTEAYRWRREQRRSEATAANLRDEEEE